MERYTMLGKIGEKISGFPSEFLRVLWDLVEKLASKERKMWFMALKKFHRKEECWALDTGTFLKLVSGYEHEDEILFLDATDGTKTFAKEKNVFSLGFGDYVADYEKGADEPSQPTPKTKVSVHELVKDATYAQIFGFLSADVGSLCLTEHQIIDFTQKYESWLLTDGHGKYFNGAHSTFCLFRSQDNFVIAEVVSQNIGRVSWRKDPHILQLHKYGFPEARYAGFRPRVVVAELTA